MPKDTKHNKRLPILEINPGCNSDRLGRIVGYAGGDGDPILFNPKGAPVIADLGVKNGICYFVCRTDNGPTPPPLPKEFEAISQLTLSTVGSGVGSGYLRANAFLEKCITRILSYPPDLEAFSPSEGMEKLWRATLTGIDKELCFYIKLESQEDQFSREQYWENIFQFHRNAISWVHQDLAEVASAAIIR